jgi:hypothetical protein
MAYQNDRMLMSVQLPLGLRIFSRQKHHRFIYDLDNGRKTCKLESEIYRHITKKEYEMKPLQ